MSGSTPLRWLNIARGTSHGAVIKKNSSPVVITFAKRFQTFEHSFVWAGKGNPDAQVCISGHILGAKIVSPALISIGFWSICITDVRNALKPVITDYLCLLF